MIWSGHRRRFAKGVWCLGDEMSQIVTTLTRMAWFRHTRWSTLFFAFQLQNIRAGFWVSSELRLLKVPPMKGMDFVVSRSIGSSLLRHMSSAVQPWLGSIEDWHLLTEVHANWEHASWPNSCVGVTLQIWELKTHDARSKNSQMLCCYFGTTNWSMCTSVYVSFWWTKPVVRRKQT